MVLNLDLNYPPHGEDSFGMDNSMNVNTNLELGLPCVQVRASYEPTDDEVIICSPRSFAEAVGKSSRNRRVIEVLDEETESQRGHSARWPANGNRRRRTSARQKSSGVNPVVHWEDRDSVECREVVMPQLIQSVPQQKAPIFSCPICMEQVVEETSTRCGHIFCKKCITTAIEVQNKCPTCRRKLKVKDVFRIYLPNSSQLDPSPTETCYNRMETHGAEAINFLFI